MCIIIVAFLGDHDDCFEDVGGDASSWLLSILSLVAWNPHAETSHVAVVAVTPDTALSLPSEPLFPSPSTCLVHGCIPFSHQSLYGLIVSSLSVDLSSAPDIFGDVAHLLRKLPKSCRPTLRQSREKWKRKLQAQGLDLSCLLASRLRL